MKIGAILQQDEVRVEVDGSFVTIIQKAAFDGAEQAIVINGTANLTSLVEALKGCQEPSV